MNRIQEEINNKSLKNPNNIFEYRFPSHELIFIIIYTMRMHAHSHIISNICFLGNLIENLLLKQKSYVFSEK